MLWVLLPQVTKQQLCQANEKFTGADLQPVRLTAGPVHDTEACVSSCQTLLLATLRRK